MPQLEVVIEVFMFVCPMCHINYILTPDPNEKDITLRSIHKYCFVVITSRMEIS